MLLRLFHWFISLVKDLFSRSTSYQALFNCPRCSRPMPERGDPTLDLYCEHCNISYTVTHDEDYFDIPCEFSISGSYWGQPKN